VTRIIEREVPILKCIICSAGKFRVLKQKRRVGTMIRPPPIPNIPERVPAKTPRAK
jgi:hypothetical protein